MLSKLRLAFTNPYTQPSSTTTDGSASSSSSTAKRARSRTVPAPSSSDPAQQAVPRDAVLPGSSHPTSLRAPPRSSSPARSVRSTTAAGSPQPTASPRARQASESPVNPSGAPSPHTGKSPVPSPAVAAGHPSSPSPSIYTPLATPRSTHFPSAPFSTPATPPGAKFYRSHSASNSPHNEPLQEHYSANSLPVPISSNLHPRKKTRSTATLPAWIVSSFSSSSSPASSSSSPKEHKTSKEKTASLENAKSMAHPPITRMPPVAVAFPLRLDKSRRGSLPMASLAPDSATRPRSPSMQMHIQTLQLQHAQGSFQRGPSASSVPPSPHTPVRLDRSPLNVPSPLSTASSPYQIVEQCQGSPVRESPPAKPARRKSILGKRRNFTTQAWNGSSSTTSILISPDIDDSSSPSGDTNRKKGNGKWHRKGRDSASALHQSQGSGDYSSLLSASKRVFSKSVDDLTSFTRSSFLSSSPINYSRPRKSVDERRVSAVGIEGTKVYNASSSNEPKSAGFTYIGLSAGLHPGENGDVEEELEGLSSDSSASFAQSPMPSEKSSSSMHSLASLQLDDRSDSTPHHAHNQHHIYKVPKLPCVHATGNRNSKAKQKAKAHRKAASSAQVQLPPSISLPGGLCIESTASILASSMDAEAQVSDGHGRSLASGNKRKSLDCRSVRSENILGTSPGLAPACDISPTLPKSAPPVPTSTASQSTSSGFPTRPSLSSKKSTGSASVCSARSSTTARPPSFGSPKAFPSALPLSPQVKIGDELPKITRQRSSQIILIEGLLQRKTDHKSHMKASSWTFPFTSSASSAGAMLTSTFASTSTNNRTQGSTSPSAVKQRPAFSNRRVSEANLREIDLSRGWKPFYAMLRGTNLYLYKIPNDMSWQAKACFSNYTGLKTFQSNLLSSSSSSSRMLSNFTASTPLQSTMALNEDRLRAMISHQSKSTYLLPIANSSLRTTQSASRGDVFELLTEDGEVAVLQAASRDEADKWRQVLSDTGVIIGNKRASYLEAIGKLDLGDTLAQQSIPRHTTGDVRIEQGPKEATRVFGVSLEQLVAREGNKIPKIADFLFKEVERRGLLETGIYRVPGENRVMQEMQAKLNAGDMLDFEANPSYSDPHNLASLTKLWLRELPEIISPAFYTAFIDANGVEGYEERLCAIRDLTWQLPAPSFHLLNRLCGHLHMVAEHELENQMHAPNLAIVFAPTILRPPEGSDSYAPLMSNLGKAAKLVASLIVQHNWIFSGQEAEEDAETDAATEKHAEVFEDVQEKQAKSAGLPDSFQTQSKVDVAEVCSDLKA